MLWEDILSARIELSTFRVDNEEDLRKLKLRAISFRCILYAFVWLVSVTNANGGLKNGEITSTGDEKAGEYWKSFFSKLFPFLYVIHFVRVKQGSAQSVFSSYVKVRNT